jgi:hypothetical protein
MIANTSPTRIGHPSDGWNTENGRLVRLETIEDLVGGTLKKCYLLSWMFKSSAQS